MKKALRQKWWGESDRLRHVCLKSSEAAATLQLLFSADSGCSWSTYEPVKFTFQSVNITNIISGSNVNLRELIEKICTLFKNSYKWISSTMIIWSLGRNLRLNRVRSSHPIIVSITPVFKINKAENESSISKLNEEAQRETASVSSYWVVNVLIKVSSVIPLSDIATLKGSQSIEQHVFARIYTEGWIFYFNFIFLREILCFTGSCSWG